MTDHAVSTKAVPIWVDYSSNDVPAAVKFYGDLLGWKEQDLGPDSGGYMFFRKGEQTAAGIGPNQDPSMPSHWTIYIGTADGEATAAKVTGAGGTVVVPPFDVLGQGRMAVFQDPAGAFISVWEPKQMGGFEVSHEASSFEWAELHSRDLARTKPFYQAVFGWGVKETNDGMPYTEWQLDGRSVAGAMAMPEMVPAEVPSYWLAYFKTADLDAAVAKVSELGGQVLSPAMEYPGGRFAIGMDSQGGAFGLIGD